MMVHETVDSIKSLQYGNLCVKAMKLSPQQSAIAGNSESGALAFGISCHIFSVQQ